MIDLALPAKSVSPALHVLHLVRRPEEVVASRLTLAPFTQVPAV